MGEICRKNRKKTHNGQTPAQKVPQWCGRISVEDRRCKAETRPVEKLGGGGIMEILEEMFKKHLNI